MLAVLKHIPILFTLKAVYMTNRSFFLWRAGIPFLAIAFLCLSHFNARAIISLTQDTWWGSTTINDDVQIHNGATLFITQNQTLIINGHIFIEPGGKMDIDNGA